MNKTILAICSGGGHWVEMRRLMPLFEGKDVCFASVYPEYSDEVAGYRYFSFQDFSRFKKLASIRSAFQIAAIIFRVRPKVVITTGSAPCLIALGLSKIFFRSKTIWIDSVANADSLSTSGGLAKYVADIWLTQWDHLAKKEGPHYWGAVI